MLSLSLRPGRAVMIGDSISLRLVRNHGSTVVLEVDAPENIRQDLMRQLGIAAAPPKTTPPQAAEIKLPPSNRPRLSLRRKEPGG